MLGACGQGAVRCLANWNTRHPFIKIISEDLCHSQRLPSFGQGTFTTCFTTKVYRVLDLNIRPFEKTWELFKKIQK